MASDTTSVPPHPTIESTANIITTPSNQTSFASLPREIRDEIYRLALPHSHYIVLYETWELQGFTALYPILSPCFSTFAYANEACEMYFKSNRICIDDDKLPELLSKDGIRFIHHSMPNFIRVASKGPFDVTRWLRDIVINVFVEGKLDDLTLAGRIGLLLECPVLRQVKVGLHGNRTALKREMGAIVSALQALAAKLGQHLIFGVPSYFVSWDRHCRSRRSSVDLEHLEMMQHKWDWSSDDGSDDTEDE